MLIIATTLIKLWIEMHIMNTESDLLLKLVKQNIYTLGEGGEMYQ